MRSSHKILVALLGASLLSTSCGARLSDEQRFDALSQGSAARSGVAAGSSPDGGELAFDDPAAGDPGAVEGAAPDDPAAGGGGGGGGEAQGPEQSAGGTAPAPGAGGGGGGGGGNPADTRAAPAGGNGGATDKGVTANEIVIANVSDISGAVPGLFEDAQLAVKAYVAMFSATEGTIYGRKLRLLALDSRLDTGANRSASIQACNEAFAGVGSVSGFDQGGAPVIRDCGIPDMRGLATTDQMKEVPNVFGINAAGKPGHRSLGMYGWAAKKDPAAVKKAAYLFIDGEVTRQLAEQDQKATAAVHGYEWVYSGAIGIAETNYSPFVQQLKSRGAEYVTFTGAYQQAAALARTMQQQGYTPKIFQPTVTAYTPEFLKVGGAAVEGAYLAVGASLIEEISANRELQTYAQWLNQVEPGAKPTAIGQFAWGAARLFVEKAKKIGPQLTRDKMLAELRSVRAYDGGGLFPNQDVGGKSVGDCTSMVQVKGGKFVRLNPAGAGTYECGYGVFDTTTNKRVPTR